MKEINGKELKMVSGGNLTTCILDFIRNLGTCSSSESGEWGSNSTIESPALGKGDRYGNALVTGGLMAMAMAVATISSVAAIGGVFSLFGNKQ